MEKDSNKQLVYYWLKKRGRKIENEWWAKVYLLRCNLKNRTDGALIRLITPIYPGEIESDADKRLQGFIRDF